MHRWVNKHHGTIRTGFGAARLDLTAACWDDDQINLRLETRGSIEVLPSKEWPCKWSAGRDVSTRVRYQGSLRGHAYRCHYLLISRSRSKTAAPRASESEHPIRPMNGILYFRQHRIPPSVLPNEATWGTEVLALTSFLPCQDNAAQSRRSELFGGLIET